MGNNTTLFQRIGGMNTIRIIVDRFYNKIINDTNIQHFFEVDNIKALKSKQTTFLAYVFGAPSIRSEINLQKAHAHLDIKEEHFDCVAQHLLDSLIELEFDKELQEEVMQIIKKTKASVLGSTH